MRVRMLVSHAGNDFSHKPGDEVEVPEHVGQAMLADGRATQPTKPAKAAKPADLAERAVADAAPETR